MDGDGDAAGQHRLYLRADRLVAAVSGAIQHIVVMGVSALATHRRGAGRARLGWPFVEGDAFHPAANVECAFPDRRRPRARGCIALAAELGRYQALGAKLGHGLFVP